MGKMPKHFTSFNIRALNESFSNTALVNSIKLPDNLSDPTI